MSLIQRLIMFLWWGPFRRPFEALVRRVHGNSSVILSGPLSGMHFSGGMAQILGIYEPYLQELLFKHLSQGDILYDIGANNGFFTLLGSKMAGRKGRVYAFEPLPKNISKLKTHIEINNSLNCFVIEQAVSNTTGTTKLFYSQDNATPTIVDKAGRQESLLISTITLDEFVGSHPKPSLIKLDIEGAEGAALSGAKSLLEGQFAPVWIIEIHDPENDASVKDLLACAGYQIEKIQHPRRDEPKYPYHLLASK